MQKQLALVSLVDRFNTHSPNSPKPPELLVAWVSTGKSHITLTIQITKVNYVFPVAVPVSNNLN